MSTREEPILRAIPTHPSSPRCSSKLAKLPLWLLSPTSQHGTLPGNGFAGASGAPLVAQNSTRRSACCSRPLPKRARIGSPRISERSVPALAGTRPKPTTNALAPPSDASSSCNGPLTRRFRTRAAGPRGRTPRSQSKLSACRATAKPCPASEAGSSKQWLMMHRCERVQSTTKTLSTPTRSTSVVFSATVRESKSFCGRTMRSV
mmetsp:Transcript_90973/g.253200  ORF Transcript_90973/g.253200 Transcript_90973/m.253200 type:complete len:205 (-) Transcript_90973:1044-1658(-)